VRSKEKICLIIPSLQAGGMERVMSELANYSVEKGGYEVHLILYGIKREIFYNISDKIIIHKPIFEFDNTKRTWSTLKTIFYLRKKLKEINPVASLSFGEYWNNLVLLSTLGTKIPVFVSDRSQPNKSLGRVQNNLRNWLYPKAKGVIAQTEKAKLIYKSLYSHSNICVIGNPIRIIGEETFTDEGRENIVLMVGRLISTKHQDRLVEIFLKIEDKNWILVLIGYDHLGQNNSDRLSKLINDNNAKDRVILAGKQSDVEKYYLSSKIFAFTSSSEGFPNVIGEALSAGLPVVSYDCDAGPSDLIIHGENGYLVPVFDDIAFQFYLEKLMNDADLRKKFSQKGREDIKRFDRKIICEAFLTFVTK